MTKCKNTNGYVVVIRLFKPFGKEDDDDDGL